MTRRRKGLPHRSRLAVDFLAKLQDNNHAERLEYPTDVPRTAHDEISLVRSKSSGHRVCSFDSTTNLSSTRRPHDGPDQLPGKLLAQGPNRIQSRCDALASHDLSAGACGFRKYREHRSAVRNGKKENISDRGKW